MTELTGLELNSLLSTYFGALFASILMFLLLRYVRRIEARRLAKAIIARAQTEAQEPMDEAQKNVNDYKSQEIAKHKRELRKIEDRANKIKATYEERKAELDDDMAEEEALYNEKQSIVDRFDHKVKQQDQRFQKRVDKKAHLQSELIKKLEQQAKSNKNDFITQKKEKLIEEHKVETAKWLQLQIDEAEANASESALNILDTALNRFARAYCPERGIGYLNFTSKQQKDIVLGPEQSNLRAVEKIVGVDLVYDEENNSVNVYGFDPVRRELGRATIHRMMKEKRPLNQKRIEELAARIKTEIFQKIVKDGDKIEKELGIKNLHREVKNMMGALKYRYSFTQNQYYHCGEVGFLCGLLASELGDDVKKARRIGLLHDIGKAMDHTKEGGHAVIGADFIQENGENEDVVHAVRAHHFDVQPNENVDYLVIAADAISGARPGARRSTQQTYSQKIQDLQSIAGDHPAVTDTHILNAGREVRVYVDGKRLDDRQALSLSGDIANKIENEMAYPGQIKVTVVRKTEAVEMAR